MSTWAVVPMKSFLRGKSRLASVLGAPDRAALSRALFEHVLSAVRDCRVIDGCLVVTDGDDVAQVARALGAEVWPQPKGASLGECIDDALGLLENKEVDRALVLMADLPLVDSHTLDRLLERVSEKRSRADLAIAPDTHEEGTSALVLAPPRRIATCFGHEDSFSHHLARAAEEGLHVAIFRNPKLAFDVDTPADLRHLQESLGDAPGHPIILSLSKGGSEIVRQP